jgi:hypothetical protein
MAGRGEGPTRRVVPCLIASFDRAARYLSDHWGLHFRWCLSGGARLGALTHGAGSLHRAGCEYVRAGERQDPTVLSSSPCIKREAWRFPNVRASNEGSLRPRVARAQGISRLPFFPFSPSTPPPWYWREWPRLPSTARIGRAPFHRARSASKEGTWPLPRCP